MEILSGIVVETTTSSWTGRYLYSDFCFEGSHVRRSNVGEVVLDSTLNEFSRVPFIGILAGVARITLAVIHIFIHLSCAIFTLDKGHLYHAGKGVCEGIRGIVEASPIIGRVFANVYSSEPPGWTVQHHEGYTYSWWMVKIYNPQQPDALDKAAGLWNELKLARPNAYVFA